VGPPPRERQGGRVTGESDGRVRVDVREGCAWVTLDRPPLNLFTAGLVETLRQAFEPLTRDPAVRAAVITGAGRAMTGGMQVQVLRDLDVAGARALISGLHEAIQVVHEAPFPTVCMMNGACLGAGFELAMACDLRVAAAGAIMGLPEVRVGVPSVIEAALLPGLVGPGRAAELLLTGETVAAEQALAWGLVNRVVPRDALETATRELVGRILACSPTAVRLQKELIVRWRSTDLRTAIAYGVNAFAQTYATSEVREATDAFLEKRPARFGAAAGAPRRPPAPDRAVPPR
jgi:enoyl-CoA hydratase/carnithine racemase